MSLRWPHLINLSVVVATTAVFLCGGHFAAEALIGAQQKRQLEELNTVALRRSEAVVDYGIATLRDLVRSRSVTCDPASLQAVRLHVYQRGAVKDVRLVDRNGSVRCSAYSETLEFDQGWVTRDVMLASSDPTVRLFRVDQFFGIALGVMKDISADGGIVAILGVSGSLFDIMPEELREHSDVMLTLSDGQAIAHSSPDHDRNADGDLVELSAGSVRFPFRTVIHVEGSALATWNREPYEPILWLAGGLGFLFGLLLSRALLRPRNPIDEIDRAIAAGEFRPYLQPIFDLETRTIVGAEMLARWVRADGAVLPPARFIELAEESGRIEAITWQLLSSTLRDMQPLLSRKKRFSLSINISPRQFVTPAFVPDLRRLVSAAGVATRQVTLELTERQAFEDLEKAAGVVAEVRSYGFKVAIDDVGIGHSGLSQIQRLGADVLKVDKFFVDSIRRDANAGIVVEMLVRLAREMAMTVVAEGIEQEEQLRELVAVGVAEGQGYLVAPPLPVAAFMQFLDERGAAIVAGPAKSIRAA